VPSKPAAALIGTLVAGTAPAVALLAVLFVVRDFALVGRSLVVRRLLWSTSCRASAPPTSA
jgi:hypothetical protein